jgi:membrane-bound lytic murein transglycosylase A
MKKIIKFAFVSQLTLFFLTQMSCYPALKKEALLPKHALKQVWLFYPSFKDDSNFDSLILAVERNLSYLGKLNPSYTFKYGKDKILVSEIIESQNFFLNLIRKNPDDDQLEEEIKRHFRIYKATGRTGNGNVLFTGYFEPVFEGSLVPNDTYKYPIYSKPEDLLSINLSLFSDKYKGKRIFARIEGKDVIPYFSRYQIEMENALRGRGLEIAWLKDPVDIAFLHIQGSGRIKLPDGKSISVGYAAKNGRPYHSIGKYLIDRGFISRAQMSMQAIRKTLADNPEIVGEVLNQNQSYIFFRVLDDLPIGSINIPVTPGRTIALDGNLFPRGALGFIVCQKPVIDNEGNILEWTDFSRFVLNQDTGGAIKGAGRADIFWGRGLYAEIAAGHLKHEGELYILVKKPER